MWRTLSRPGPWLVLILLLHATATLLWIGADRQLPDGDEAGHLGAIELYRDVTLERGPMQAAREAFESPSDYPPLYALANAYPLALFRIDGPFPRGVAPLQVLWSSLALLAVAGLAARLAARYAGSDGNPAGADRFRDPAWTGVFAAAAYATFPLAAALARQAMPEPMVALWTAVTLWLALRTDGFTRTGPTLLLAAALAAGLMTKQTYALYVAGPLLVLGIDALRLRGLRALPRLALAPALGALLPALWLWTHWKAQVGYALSSAATHREAHLLEELIYYPVVLFGSGVGLLWAVPLVVGLIALLARRRDLPLALLLATLLTLAVVSKKYPRLIVPALPLTAAVLALGLREYPAPAMRRALTAGALTAGTLQHLALSFPVPGLPPRLGLWEPPLLQRIDPTCPQVWIRRPSRDDLGFDAIQAALRQAGATQAGPHLVFLYEPAIPCDYETTFGYLYHLSEYLRRHGLEVGEIPARADDPARFDSPLRPRLVVSTRPWCEASTPDPACLFRYLYRPAGQFTAVSDRLHFDLYFYQRAE